MLVRLDTSGPKVNVCHSVVKELDFMTTTELQIHLMISYFISVDKHVHRLKMVTNYKQQFLKKNWEALTLAISNYVFIT